MKPLTDTTKRALTTFLAVLVGLSLTASPVGGAAQPIPLLKPETRQAFDRYVRLTDVRNEAELKRGSSLLWMDSLAENERTAAYTALKNGEVKIQKLETRENGEIIRCPDGMIHHWLGVVFIPGAKTEDVLHILEDYDNHSIYFTPDVERSKIESHDGDHFRVFLRFRRHKIITVVLNTEHDVQYFRDARDKAHSRSSAVRIAEVENAGKSDEREKQPGEDGGFLWGMETWWRIQDGDGGVYVQSEIVSLTRNIPTGLGWMIGPFVNSIPKETLTFTLEATRRTAEGKMKKTVAEN